MTAEPVRLPSTTVPTIHAFLRAHALAPGLDGGVVGLSGGIDSAVVARLTRDALGADHLLGVLLPDAEAPGELERSTEEYGRALGVEVVTVRIGPVVAALRERLPEVRDRVTLGNTTARLRMAVLYAVARERHRLVVGTGNKSELLLGYFTKYGDGGADVFPIGDLYKTQVYALAEELGVPADVRARAPSAGFWEGQTDEEELGVTYGDADRVLRALEELRRDDEISAATGVPPSVVDAIVARVRANRHKRRPAPVAKLGLRTVGIDWRD